MQDYRVVGLPGPDLTEAEFVAILQEAHSPALSAASAVWNYCRRRGVSLFYVRPTLSGNDRANAAIAHSEHPRQRETGLSTKRAAANLSDLIFGQFMPTAMPQVMFGRSQHLEIFKYIVRPFFVAVMDFPVERKVVSKVLFHDENVLQDVTMLIGARMAGAEFLDISRAMPLLPPSPLRALRASLGALPRGHTTFLAPARAIMLGAVGIHQKDSAAVFTRNFHFGCLLRPTRGLGLFNARAGLRHLRSAICRVTPFLSHVYPARHFALPYLAMLTKERIARC